MSSLLTGRIELSRPDLIPRHRCGGRSFAVRNPATLEVITEVPDCGAAEAADAVEAARWVFPEWKARTAKERSNLLRAWFNTLNAECRGSGEAHLEWFAEEAKRAYGEVIPKPLHGRPGLM
jgi:succinate-semialdehyde dehydrogenase/glutarate-semialdehyde dehydrogenase